MAYHYNPEVALEELDEKVLLPNPVAMRDMLVRTALPTERTVEANRLFTEYQKNFAAAMRLGKEFLTLLAHEGAPKAE